MGRGATDSARHGEPVLWLDAPPPPDLATAVELIRHLRDRAPDLKMVVTGPGEGAPFAAAFPDAPPLHLAPRPGPGTAACAAFHDAWRPTLAVVYPTGLSSPAAQHALSRGTRVFLVARDLPRSWRNPWRLGLGSARRLLRTVEHACGETGEIAAQLRALGLPAARASVCGPLAEGGGSPPCNEAERAALSVVFGGRPVWLAAGTTEVEERVVVAAYDLEVRQTHRLLLVVMPDDPARGPSLADRLRDEGWDVALRSDDVEPEADTQIYVADTADELGLWLRLAPLSFLGGTLSGQARIDPYHAAALGSVILHGPELGAHAPQYRRLDAASAARTVEDAGSLAAALSELLAPDRAARMACAAWEVATEGSLGTGVLVDRILRSLELAEVK